MSDDDPREGLTAEQLDKRCAPLTEARERIRDVSDNRTSDDIARARAFFALSQATPEQERQALAKLRAA